MKRRPKLWRAREALATFTLWHAERNALAALRLARKAAPIEADPHTQGLIAELEETLVRIRRMRAEPFVARAWVDR